MTAKHLFQIAGNLIVMYRIMWLEVKKDSILYLSSLFKDMIQPYFYTYECKTPKNLLLERHIIIRERNLKMIPVFPFRSLMKTSKILLNANCHNKNLCFSNQDKRQKRKKLRNMHFASKWKYRVVTTFKETSRVF